INDADITIIREISGYADALQEAKKLIASGVKGIFCTSVVMGLGAVEAAGEMNADICIVTIDTQDDALKAVQSGKLNGLIAHSGYEIGQTTINTVVNALKTGTSDNVYIDCEMLTKDNVDEYINRRDD
ncbi:MAG: sugar ABC transporter substrate-binding protein, partial [Suipraeoptans sp.]